MSIHQCNTTRKCSYNKNNSTTTHCMAEEKTTTEKKNIQTKPTKKTFPFRPPSCHPPSEGKEKNIFPKPSRDFLPPTNEIVSIGSRDPPPHFVRCEGGSSMSPVACVRAICRRCALSVWLYLPGEWTPFPLFTTKSYSGLDHMGIFFPHITVMGVT